ncbi:hypothetical protein FRC12_009668 [Ceratobasidium sp. 428]|nr:hypothetical protein FRC12_009668 [Ceratobasidium sp. 428]
MSSRSVADVFDEWKTTHDQLTHAAQSFFDACVTLLQAIDKSPAGSARDKSVDLAAMEVYNRTQTIPTVNKQVGESQLIMRRITNTSTTRMPINVLPPEVMSRIFEIVVSSSACTDDKIYLMTTSLFGHSYRFHPLASIPSVCTRWRQLAIGTPSLWSHVDIQHYLKAKSDKNVLPRTRFWLERARGAPLSLHIGTLYQDSGNGQELLSLLNPHIANISSLELSGYSGTYFWPILKLYARVCPLGSLARLALCGIKGLDDLTASPFTWPTNALHGLTSLHIGDLSPTNCPSVDQLVNMFTNSPALHTLRLWSTSFAYIDGQNHPKVDLPCLRLLQLDDLLDPVLVALLSVLVPGPLELNVRLLLHSGAGGESRAAVLSFLKRTNIFCLGLKGEGSTQLAEQLSCVPKLRILELVYHTGEPCASLNA